MEVAIRCGLEGEKSIVLGGGCIWRVEAVFEELDGVTDVRPGYAGGTAATADYETVCSGRPSNSPGIVQSACRLPSRRRGKRFRAVAAVLAANTDAVFPRLGRRIEAWAGETA